MAAKRKYKSKVKKLKTGLETRKAKSLCGKIDKIGDAIEDRMADLREVLDSGIYEFEVTEEVASAFSDLEEALEALDNASQNINDATGPVPYR